MKPLRMSACLLGGVLLTGMAAGCASAVAQPPASGHLAGRLVMEGGPLGPGGKQPGERPMSGAVTFTAAGHQPVTVKVGSSGTVSVPLHAITSTYGEEGLRARFTAEVEAWPETDQRRLNQALALAGRLHAADRRVREPYVNHLLRVAIRIMSHYGVRDGDVICAALLHDAVEDHAAELAPDGTRATALAALAEE